MNYLTRVCEPIAVFAIKHVEEKELTSLLSKNNAYIEKFGCSDNKNAISHLFIVGDLKELSSTICDKSRE
ncbi:GIY-YIG nuclease family protein [Saccharolobus islandicus]|uniref:hypothetical protein n=1 Tax=Saccharolobus islandicus TaxID=43080 RepID=UPI0030B8F10D